MTGLLVANFSYLVIGIALLTLTRVAVSWRELAERAGVAYLLGVAAIGILAAHLALIEVPLSLLEVGFVAVVTSLFALRRMRRWEAPTRPTVRIDGRSGLEWASGLVGAGALLASAVVLVHAWRTFAVRPLLEWDGWAIWGMKARALYEFGGATGPAFTSDAYPPLQHPLLLPSLEAIAFRSMGSFDSTRIHVQLILLAVGFALALWTLLRPRVPAAIAGLSVLAVLAAEPVLRQLSTNQADVPLAFFVALALVALGRWLVEGERWLLVVAVVLLGAATLTKSEGALYALVALVTLVVVTALWARERLRSAAAAAVAVALILVPWRLNVELRGLELVEYDFANLASGDYLSDRADRVRPAASGLWDQIASGSWGLLVALVAAALVSALLARRYSLAAFASFWVAGSFAGLLLVYWISVIPIDLALRWSADRTVVSIVVGAAALAPLLIAESWARGTAGLSAAAGGTRRTRASAARRRSSAPTASR